MNLKHKLTIFGILALCLNACTLPSNSKNNSFDYGTTENNTYSNSFFDFKLHIPEGWHVQSREQTEYLTEKGKDIVAGDDKSLKNILNAADINSAYLLTVFQHEVGAPVDFNPGFIVVAENMKNMPGIKTGEDYLFHTKNMLLQSQIEYSYMDSTFNKEVIGNQTFYTLNCTMNLMGKSIMQKYYSTMSNNFCLSVVTSFGTEEQKADLEKVMQSITFN